MTKGCVYYSDCALDEPIAEACRTQLVNSAPSPIVAVTLEPIDFGLNIVPIECGYCGYMKWAKADDGAWWLDHLHGHDGYSWKYQGRSPLMMFRQILAGLEALTTDVAFLIEHDVLYHPSHFQFTPPNREQVFYNEHVYKVRASDGHALRYWCNQTSGLCADRKLLVEHYRKRVDLVEMHGYSSAMGYEPGTHRREGRVDDLTCASWRSEFPNIDIRHDNNLSPSRWRKEQFRNQRYTDGWLETDDVPGWGQTGGRFREFLADLSGAGAPTTACTGSR